MANAGRESPPRDNSKRTPTPPSTSALAAQIMRSLRATALAPQPSARQLRIPRHIVRAKALRETRVTVGFQQRRDVADGVARPETDHVPRSLVVRRSEAHIAARLLDGSGDQRGRIGERTVPVEGEKAE